MAKIAVKRKPLLVVISSPSGAGKTTVCKKVLKRHPEYLYSVSFTTREKRKGEVDGKDYHFVGEKEFEKMIKRKEFAEWACVYGDYYGTSKKVIEWAKKEKKTLIMVLDVQGAFAIKRLYPESVLIFMLPPSLEELKKRLKKRATDKREDMKKRLKSAVKEISFWSNYDYVLVNENLNQTVKEVENIISAEKNKSKRFDFNLWGKGL